MAATFDDVTAIIATLPGAAEGERHGGRMWHVNDKVFAWERGYSKADLKRAGEEALPTPPLLAVRTADLDDKEAVLAAGIPGVFTMAHFDGYPSVLIQLKRVLKRELKDALVDGWLACAPPEAAEAYAKRPHLR